MPEYRSYGARDDRVAKDGDVGFIGFNNRLRPDQLQAGMLADAQNIRLDRNGEAQVRKGVELISEPLAVGTDALTLPFDLPTTGQIGDGITAILDDDAVNEIYGSCGYSDPNAAASQYIIIASNAKAIAINIATGVETDIDYPLATTISQPVDMIQAFNKVFIFRNGETALEWDGDFSGTPAFTKVPSGEYSQPKRLTPTRVDITDGKATATFASLAAMNGLDVGELFVVESVGSPATFTIGEEYMVAARDDVAFTIDFFVQLDDASNVSGVVIQQHVSVGLGFTHMPAPPFAVYHQRRLAMPFRFDVDNAVDSFTSRGILDEVILSEPLDSDTYDQVYAQYRFNAGTADFVVGLHSFAEDTLLVFNRNSIHTIFDTLSLANSKNRLLTNEVGCVARKSIIQVGNQVIFLSDNGIYGVQFIDEYNLRGTETPLSEPINSTIQRINKNAWENSVATYFDNRYFIALPLDDATSNNAILVYNFLNKQWESVDQVGDANFQSANLIVVGDGDARAVYVVNDIGGVHRLDNRLDGIDRVITQIGGTQQNLGVGGSITTRQYTLGTLDRKRWKEFDIHAQSSEDNTSDFDIGIETENPDTVESLGSLSTFNGSALAVGEDVSIRGRIGNRRGYGLQFTINNTSGRPRIRAIETEGSTAMRSTQKAI
jgi:hypothetical protein